jgi:hypothetical protein
MLNTTLFASNIDDSNMYSRRNSQQAIQAFYNEHANAATRLRQFKWIIVAMLLVVGIAAWADENNIPNANGRVRSDSAAESIPSTIRPSTTDSTATMFIDGPTGFVFVYTAEGWKFVPGSATRN